MYFYHSLSNSKEQLGLCGGSDGEEFTWECRRPASGRFPRRRAWQPTPVLLPGESHGRSSPGGYGPRGLKESDRTEALSTEQRGHNIQTGFPGGSAGKNPPAMQEILIGSLGQEDLLKKETATHFSIFAWRIPRAEQSGGLQSMGSQELDMI